MYAFYVERFCKFKNS
ncbi:hypothetical protein CP8484711_1027A, partial [Chlamydia psittaci 84-8471/1]